MSRKDRRHDPEAAERVTSIIEAAERAAAALIDKADENAKRYLAEAEAEADRAAAARLQALNETAEALISQAEAIRREAARLLESLRQADPSGQGGARPGVAGAQAPDPGLQGRSRPAPAPGSQDLSEQAPVPGDGGPRGKHLAAVPGPSPATGADPWPGPGPGSGQPPGAGDGPAPAFPAGPAPSDGQPQYGQGLPGHAPAPGQPQGAPGQVPLQGAPAPTSPQGAPAQLPPQGDPHRSDGAAGARLLATQMAVSGYSRREIEAKLRRGFRIEDPTAILDAILGPGD